MYLRTSKYAVDPSTYTDMHTSTPEYPTRSEGNRSSSSGMETFAEFSGVDWAEPGLLHPARRCMWHQSVVKDWDSTTVSTGR